MLHTGDCRLILPELAEQGVRVQTCITSPPYYGLRDYGYPDQIGLESSVPFCLHIIGSLAGGAAAFC